MLHPDPLRCRRGGRERALVFVHGWSCDRTYWPHRWAFRRQHRVVAVDLAGHGDSGGGRQSWTMPAFGDECRGGRGARARGAWSWSVTRWAVTSSSRPRSRATGSAASCGSDATNARRASARQGLDAFVEPFREDFVGDPGLRRRCSCPGADPELVEWVAADMSAAPPDIALDALGQRFGNAARPRAPRPRASPVVSINPDHRPTDVESLRRHGVTVSWPMSAHFPMLEDPDGGSTGSSTANPRGLSLDGRRRAGTRRGTRPGPPAPPVRARGEVEEVAVERARGRGRRGSRRAATAGPNVSLKKSQYARGLAGLRST